MSSDQIAKAIRAFLANARDPVLLEPGAPQIPLRSENYAVEEQNGRLLLQAWNDGQSFTRRVTSILKNQPARLELEVQRFGQRPGSCALLDLADPRSRERRRREDKRDFRDRFGRFLHREFPGWEVTGLSTEPDLQHSLSPAYPRAMLRRSQLAWAAIGVDRESVNPDAVLTFGLIWLDYLRRREHRSQVQGLILLMPAGESRTTQFRLRVLASATQFHLFTYDENDIASPVEIHDCGNFETVVEDLRGMAPPEASQSGAMFARIASLPGVAAVPLHRGAISLRIQGLEFARWSPEGLVYGLETKRPATASHTVELEALASELARLRGPDARDRAHPLWVKAPELRLEASIRNGMRQIDAGLLPSPVYGQAPAMEGREGGLIDLLACDRSGRLAVLELKVDEDIHLPLQALDYWMRVRWHAERGEFGGQGYFPGIAVRRQAPRLYLIAPALRFHPANETVLRFFPPEVEVERIGVGEDWSRQLRVMFRLRQAERPMAETIVTEGECDGTSNVAADQGCDLPSESGGGTGGVRAVSAGRADGDEQCGLRSDGAVPHSARVARP